MNVISIFTKISSSPKQTYVDSWQKADGLRIVKVQASDAECVRRWRNFPWKYNWSVILCQPNKCENERICVSKHVKHFSAQKRLMRSVDIREISNTQQPNLRKTSASPVAKTDSLAAPPTWTSSNWPMLLIGNRTF